MAHNQESDDVFKLKFFRKMFSDYTKEFKVGVQKMAGTATSPVPEATTPPQAGSGKRQPKSSSTVSSEPLSEVGSGENMKGSKEGSNEKIADAKEFAKQDDEEFENDGGAMAQSKIRNRNLQWKPSAGEEKAKERKKSSDEKRSGSQSKDRETSPYMTAKKKQSPYESAGGRDLDQGIRKRRNSGNRKKKNGDKSGKSGRSGRTERQGRANNQRRKATSRTKTDDRTDERSPGRKTSPANTSPVKTDAGSPIEQTSREPTVSDTSATPTEERKIDCADIDTNTTDFKTAIRLMEILKRNNILENALFPAQNETLRSFFEGGMKNPDRKIMELISKAMDFVLDAVFFKGEDMDCLIDNELKAFIVDRFKSKPLLLDVIISRPEFLPQSWGGRTVVLRHIEATVLVQPDKKEKK